MYQTGDRVVYGSHGVCCVASLEERVIDRKIVQYLALEPVGQEGARYLVPTHNPAAMAKLRKMLTKQEMESLLHPDVVRSEVWIRDENTRKQTYRELIAGGDRAKLMAMVQAIYRHKAAQTAAGKRCISATKTSCGMRKSSCPVKWRSLWRWNTTGPGNTCVSN